jgi:hypothetical protein
LSTTNLTCSARTRTLAATVDIQRLTAWASYAQPNIFQSAWLVAWASAVQWETVMCILLFRRRLLLRTGCSCLTAPLYLRSLSSIWWMQIALSAAYEWNSPL